jgi:hypothetical protein
MTMVTSMDNASPKAILPDWNMRFIPSDKGRSIRRFW